MSSILLQLTNNMNMSIETMHEYANNEVLYNRNLLKLNNFPLFKLAYSHSLTRQKIILDISLSIPDIKERLNILDSIQSAQIIELNKAIAADQQRRLERTNRMKWGLGYSSR